jgi:hypothetical protein
MKKIKLKFIENGRISKDQMNQIFGGGMCREYSRCDAADGRANHCGIYEVFNSSTDKKDICTKSNGGLYQISSIAINLSLMSSSSVSNHYQLK